jgi:hypothetical protein
MRDWAPQHTNPFCFTPTPSNGVPAYLPFEDKRPMASTPSEKAETWAW